MTIIDAIPAMILLVLDDVTTEAELATPLSPVEDELLEDELLVDGRLVVGLPVEEEDEDVGGRGKLRASVRSHEKT